MTAHPKCNGKLRVDLDANVAIIGGSILRLTAREAELLAILEDGGKHSLDDARSKMFGHIKVLDPENLLAHHLHNLRAKLKPEGIKINAVPLRRLQLVQEADRLQVSALGGRQG